MPLMQPPVMAQAVTLRAADPLNPEYNSEVPWIAI